MAIEKNRQRLNPVSTFHYLVDGQAILRRLVKNFNLCPKLCFIQKDESRCEGISEGYCSGACEQKESVSDYNKKLQKAIEALKAQPSFAIVDKGVNGTDQSCILIEEGKFYGMGYIPSDTQITTLDALKDQLTCYKENSFIRNLVIGFAARFPSKVKVIPR